MISEGIKLAWKEYKAQQSGKGDPLGIMQEIKICSYNQIFTNQNLFKRTRRIKSSRIQMDHLILAWRQDFVLIYKNLMPRGFYRFGRPQSEKNEKVKI